MTMHLVAIVADEHRADVQQVVLELGWGPDSFSVPLSPSGAHPVTHWGLATPVTEAFVAMTKDPAFSEVRAKVEMDLGSIEKQRPRARFDGMLSRLNLQTVGD